MKAVRSIRLAAEATIVLTLIALVGCQADGPQPASPTQVHRGTALTGASEAPQPAERAPLPNPTGLCARSVLDRMNLASRVGQLVMVGVPARNPATGRSTVLAYRLGGVFLTGRSSAGVARTRSAVNVLQTATVPWGPRLDVALDEEGGAVRTLRGPGVDEVPSARRQGQQPQVELSQATARWSAQLRDAGITLNLAPVADTVTAADKHRNPPIGAFDREYGAAPADVGNRIATVVSAMDSAGLGSTLKHFPGLGRVRVNTDVSTGARDDRATMTDANLRPFAAGIAAGATAVMVSSASYPRMDTVNIATFSRPIITGLLRDRMGFHGLVLSDDLGSAVAVHSLPVSHRAAFFVAAGGDIALTVRLADARLMTAELSRRARMSGAFRATVDAAALRVLTSKASRGLLACG